MTYARLLEEVERCSAMLTALGVAKGDRVALIVPNSPPYVISLLRLSADRRDRGREQPALHEARDGAPAARRRAEGRARSPTCCTRDFADVFGDLRIANVVVTRLNDYMPPIKKLLAPIAVFRKTQRAAGKPWPPVPSGRARCCAGTRR